MCALTISYETTMPMVGKTQERRKGEPVSPYRSIDEARVALGDPSLPAEALYDIVQQFPELTREAAQHPNAYPELREWAATQTVPSSQRASSRRLWIWISVAVAALVALALVVWFVVVPLLSNDDREQARELVAQEEQARQDVLDARDNAVEVLNSVLTRTDSLGDKTYLEIEDVSKNREDLEQVMTSADAYFALVDTVATVETEVPTPTTTAQEVDEQDGGELKETVKKLRATIAICTGLLDDLTLGIDEVTVAVEEKSRGDAEAALQEAIDAGETVYTDSDGQVDDDSLRETLRTLLDDGNALLNDAESTVADLDAKREEITEQTDLVSAQSMPSFESLFGGYINPGESQWELTSAQFEFIDTLCEGESGPTCGWFGNRSHQFLSEPEWNGSCFEIDAIVRLRAGVDSDSTVYACPRGRGGEGDDSRDRVYTIQGLESSPDTFYYRN